MRCTIEVDCSDEGQEFFNSSVRKARKIHKCSECEDEIKPKENYEHVFGKWRDEIGVYNTCSACLEIREHFMCSYRFTSIWEDLKEYHDGDLSIDELVGLSVPAQKKLIDMIIEED